MTNLFETIIRENKRMEHLGWCEESKAITLASIVLALRPECSVEIGIFGGRSFLPIALAHKAIGRGVAIGIDPWSNLIATQVQPTQADKEWWKTCPLDEIHAGFMKLMADHKLEDFTKIIRNESKHVPAPRKIGLLHVDGGHDKTAIEDTMKFAPAVQLGGVCVLDDIGAFGDSTTKAVGLLKTIGFTELYKLGTGAVFLRTR